MHRCHEVLRQHRHPAGRWTGVRGGPRALAKAAPALRAPFQPCPPRHPWRSAWPHPLPGCCPPGRLVTVSLGSGHPCSAKPSRAPPARPHMSDHVYGSSLQTGHLSMASGLVTVHPAQCSAPGGRGRARQPLGGESAASSVPVRLDFLVHAQFTTENVAP